MNATGHVIFGLMIRRLNALYETGKFATFMLCRDDNLCGLMIREVSKAYLDLPTRSSGLPAFNVILIFEIKVNSLISRRRTSVALTQ